MKVLLFLVLFVSLSFGFVSHSSSHLPPFHVSYSLSLPIAANDTCEINYSCAAASQNCSETVFCYPDYTCDEETNTCTKLLDNNEHCEEDFQCKSGFCGEKSTCEDVVFAAIGESCSNYKECSYFQAFCNNFNVCEALPSIGEACNSNFECASNAICNQVTNQCIDMFSFPNGTACTSDYDCQKGLYCDTESYSCKIPIIGSHKACITDLDCRPNEICACPGINNGSVTVCVGDHELNQPTQSQLDATLALYTCMANSKDECLQFSKDGDPYICNICKKEICNYINAIPFAQSAAMPGDCRYPGTDLKLKQLCDESPHSRVGNLILIIVCGAIAGIIILVTLIGVTVWKMKKGHNKSIVEEEPLIN